MNDSDFFDQCFTALTGHPQPMHWQWRLYKKLLTGDIPRICNLPTGLGKTSILVVWMLALVKAPANVARRMVYVVDRRTVVDQATDLAGRMVKNWKGTGLFETDPPAISTLRGQLADNRQWSRDPSRPAIIIGTVDLIGSALLFSGYRSSYKRRPLEAGLLGQDSLLVLDEAHLSKPFEKLINSIAAFQQSNQQPMRIIRMSATSDDSTDSKSFTLQFDDGNLTGDDAKDTTISKRFGASKTLSVVESEKSIETIATEADKLAAEKPGSRTVIFVRTPKQVADIRKALEKKKKDYTTRIAQLTGTMRGLERDELVDTEKRLSENDHERRVMQRFLKPENDPSQGECFLISTSAGEVGFDLNADHMVCDATTVESLIQRLGRVNRRGEGTATIVIVREPVKMKGGKPVELKGLDLAIANTLKLLNDAKEPSGLLDVSPKNIAALKSGKWKGKYEDACSPEPTTVELTDILLDAWSMTSITEPMPGRPEVGPWLRGIDKGQAQTTIAWRAELELSLSNPKPEKALQAVFGKHPIRPHESLTVSTGHLLRIPQANSQTQGPSARSDVNTSRGPLVARAGCVSNTSAAY